jgi:serine phosphatase RsbU (regulator of sigma subunit)
MNNVSLTATETFRSRAQRSEARRAVLWSAVLIGMILMACLRRALGGHVMSLDRVFVPYVGVLAAGLTVQVAMLAPLRRAIRTGSLLPGWVWRAGAVFDLAVPMALLTVVAYESPRGEVAALSGPALLMMPMVVLLSVLRLRPRFTLITGLAAAAFHALLAARAIRIEQVPAAQVPVLFGYGFILALMALAAALVAREMRGHVAAAAEEATAHEQANRHIEAVQHDLSVAREIQAGLLPAGSPKFDGFDIAGMNRPADQTGGDYFDWQQLPDGRLVTVLADVTGHGIGPAIVMAVCRAYARASAAAIREPPELMARLNDLLHADLPADRFITLAIAMLQPDGRVELLSAGHGPSFLYRAATGRVTQFGGDGLPLAVMPGEAYGPTASFVMDEGDVLVMLTDGFFEWQRPADGEAFGIARLHETIVGSVKCAANDMIRQVDDAVRAFAAGSNQPDDMTAVVIKRTAPSCAVAAAAPVTDTGERAAEVAVAT